MNDKALEWLLKAEKNRQELNDDKQIHQFILRLLHMKSDVLCRIGDYLGAHKCLLEAKEYWKRHHSKDSEAESWTYINLGNIYLSQNDFKEAFKCYERALKIREKVGKPHLLALAYIHLTNYYVKFSRVNPHAMIKLADCANQAIYFSNQTSEHFYVEDLARWHLAEIEIRKGKGTQAIKDKRQALMELERKLPSDNSLKLNLRQDLNVLERQFNI